MLKTTKEKILDNVDYIHQLEIFMKKNKIKLPPPTQEQNVILNRIFTHKNNAIVSSCPGSGKTTMNQYISLIEYILQTKNHEQVHSNVERKLQINVENILVLMYNRALSVESTKKFKKNKCKNIKCQTIHSFACNNYKTKNRSYDDTLLLDILYQDTKNTHPFCYDKIILDEFQDATELLFLFVQKIIRDNGKVPQIIILGDPFQELYKFRGADSRFMTLADDIFCGGYYRFDKCEMSYTNRCPQCICTFINECSIGSPISARPINSHKMGGNIRVCIGNMNKIIVDEIKLLWKSSDNEYSVEDIMIIVPSLKNIVKLKNTLTRNGLYVAVSDSDNVDAKTTKDKILITTFHGSKGLERKIVFVAYFSSDYYKYFAKEFDVNVMPNTFYVALSRSSDRLFLIRSSDSTFPVWCDRNKLEKMRDEGLIKLYEEPIGKRFSHKDDESEVICETKDIKEYFVTDLLKNIPTEFKQLFAKNVKFNVLKYRRYSFDYRDVVCTKKSNKETEFYEKYSLYENVSRFIGQSITIMFEMYLYDKQKTIKNVTNKKPIILDSIDIKIKELKKIFPNGNYYTKYYDKYLSNACVSISFADILYYCTLKSSLDNDDVSYLNQIRYLGGVKDIFDIPFEENMNSGDGLNNFENSKLITYLEAVVDEYNESIFEKSIDCECFGTKIYGKIDILCDNCRVIEIKFKNCLDVEDLVQLFLYNYLMKRSGYNTQDYKYEIFNAKTGEHYEMSSTIDGADDLVKMLLFPIKIDVNAISNEEFIEKYANYTFD